MLYTVYFSGNLCTLKEIDGYIQKDYIYLYRIFIVAVNCLLGRHIHLCFLEYYQENVICNSLCNWSLQKIFKNLPELLKMLLQNNATPNH